MMTVRVDPDDGGFKPMTDVWLPTRLPDATSVALSESEALEAEVQTLLYAPNRARQSAAASGRYRLVNLHRDRREC